MSRRVVLVAAALVLFAAGCTQGVRWRDAPAPTASGTSIAWTDCAQDARSINPSLPTTLRIECGTVTVPLDWKRPRDDQKLTIALMRARSTRQTNRIGSLLFNPGGPGGSAIEYLPYIAPELSGLLARFDLVAFDPRGVGRSSAVKCFSDEDIDELVGAEPDPRSDASFNRLVAQMRQMAEMCTRKYGDRLTFFSTEQTARDMDRIRAALGDEKLNYLGYSYGTQLGAVYAHLFPKNIRAMVLDGAVDPLESPIASAEAQARGFERALDNFAAWCRATPAQCPIASDPKGSIIDALDSARTSPARGSDGRVATAGWIFYAVVASLYSQESWRHLGLGIAELRRGDPQIIFLLADLYLGRDPNGKYDNQMDANVTINCADSEQEPTIRDIRVLQADWRTKYPFFGGPLATGLITCAVWTAKADPYPIGPAAGAPPILVVGTTGDPATPYENTAKLAELLGTGVVVTWQGEGHTAYPQTRCLRETVDAYFIDLKVPARDPMCPAR